MAHRRWLARQPCLVAYSDCRVGRAQVNANDELGILGQLCLLCCTLLSDPLPKLEVTHLQQGPAQVATSWPGPSSKIYACLVETYRRHAASHSPEDCDKGITVLH